MGSWPASLTPPPNKKNPPWCHLGAMNRRAIYIINIYIICSAVSAGHWREGLLSAWPRRSSPRQRHCAVTTLVSMETAMSTSASALKSTGGVPGSRLLPLGWGTSNFCRLCQRPSVRFRCVEHNMCTRAFGVSSHVVCVSLCDFFLPAW